MDFSCRELDLLYECVRLQANELRRRGFCEAPLEPGSWAERVFALDAKLTCALHARRQGWGA